MNPAIELLGFGAAIPAAISFAVVWLAKKLLPPNAAARYAAAVAMSAAFFLSSAIYLAGDGLVPNRHWHWLVYLGIAASVIGPVALASGVQIAERWLLYLLLAIVAACLLVPTWSSLQQARPALLMILASYLFFLMSLLDALPDRLLGPLFLRLLCAIAAAVAILIAATVSLKMGLITGISAAAMLGFCTMPLGVSQATAARGLIPVFSVIVVGLAFVEAIEPQPPNIGLLLAPTTILGLWAFAWGPLARLTGLASIAAQCGFVLVPLGVVGSWSLIAGEL